jgi:RES domain-containing protein
MLLPYTIKYADEGLMLITLTDHVEKLNTTDLPDDWAAEPPNDSTKEIGSTWATKADTAVLRVPSVLVPKSWNYLLNPAHRDFKKIRITGPIPFVFDARLWKEK